MKTIRRRLGQVLRDRVGGPDADAVAQEIWGAPGPRWYHPDDVIWHVNGDGAMYTGGLRSLLLQSLHPAAMAGVAGHSGYRSDPWGRLQRTSNFIAMTTYGPIEAADELINKIRAIHERVRGKTDTGDPYRASDPHLLAWVHIAETESFLTAFQHFGDRRLSQAEADAYVASAAVVGEKLGGIDLPRTEAALRQALESYRPELRASPAAIDAADFILKTPPVPGLARLGYWMLAAGAVATLPRWARAELGIRYPRALDPILRAIGRFATAAIRWALTDPGLADASRATAAANVVHQQGREDRGSTSAPAPRSLLTRVRSRRGSRPRPAPLDGTWASSRPVPEDFDDFWRCLADAARGVALEITVKPSRLPRTDLVYFTSLGGQRIGGWLVRPKGAPTSAVVSLHGYGGSAGPGREAVPQSAISFHPVARGLPRLSRDPVIPGGSSEHVLHGIGSRETYVHGGCAADVWCAISALEQILDAPLGQRHDGLRLGFRGVSFGGGIGAMAVPFDDRVDAASLQVPSFGSNPERLRTPCTGSGAAVAAWVREHPEALEVLDYFDAATSAGRIQVPTLIAPALEDPSVPPVGQWAVAHAVAEELRAIYPLTAGHRNYPGDRAEQRAVARLSRDLFATGELPRHP